MPFVQRDPMTGKIKGIYGAPQPQDDGTDLAPEELPEDDPEVIEFLSKFTRRPIPSMTQAEYDKMQEDREELAAESQKLNETVLFFHRCFSELETALGALLYAILNKPESHIAYALYFSADGFHARVGLVHNAVEQFVFEAAQSPRDKIHAVGRLWPLIRNRITTSQTTRNKLAHGVPQILHIRGKRHVVHVSPAFDVNRVGRKIPTGTVPGLKEDVINKDGYFAMETVVCVDMLNKIISAFNRGDVATWHGICQRLEARLKT
jgi:hypothetical protein